MDTNQAPVIVTLGKEPKNPIDIKNLGVNTCPQTVVSGLSLERYRAPSNVPLPLVDNDAKEART